LKFKLLIHLSHHVNKVQTLKNSSEMMLNESEIIAPHTERVMVPWERAKLENIHFYLEPVKLMFSKQKFEYSLVNLGDCFWSWTREFWLILCNGRKFMEGSEWISTFWCQIQPSRVFLRGKIGSFWKVII